jgi:hypothetical protein
LKYSNVPPGLRGLGITFITAGLMAMAFMLFSGFNCNGMTMSSLALILLAVGMFTFIVLVLVGLILLAKSAW